MTAYTYSGVGGGCRRLTNPPTAEIELKTTRENKKRHWRTPSRFGIANPESKKHVTFQPPSYRPRARGREKGKEEKEEERQKHFKKLEPPIANYLATPPSTYYERVAAKPGAKQRERKM